MASIGTVAASQEYKNLMQLILANETGLAPRKVSSRCLRSNQSHHKTFTGFLLSYLPWVQWLWHSSDNVYQPESAQMHPTAQLVQTQMLALPPFANMTPEERLQKTVGIQIPSWLIGSPEACHIAKAAESNFGKVVGLESPPSSAYTAAGYELCRISYEAFDCTGPGHLMTLQYDGDLVVASIVETPLLNWAINPVIFSARKGPISDEMIDWLNDFINSQSPDELMLAGSGIDDPLFIDVLARSHAARYLNDHSSIPSRYILAMGAAQVAKDALESHKDDCSEAEECLDLRRKADIIAGIYRPRTPPTWPAAGLRHQEL
jgi:hypothetical protein